MLARSLWLQCSRWYGSTHAVETGGSWVLHRLRAPAEFETQLYWCAAADKAPPVGVERASHIVEHIL